ncbi:hypothetical protein [Chondrinema litorale]|uniref:hypothetical protein n=1 Tax=Chondrinema litorale TaxID=2994555 RepID=UPI002543B58F|nr:hypothetical protein [Chondrinema litorale]UZR94181.1 hypothetical protein OQ292_20290 [Chondrinema litorale]
MKRFIIISILTILSVGNELFAQCAMCRVSVENNIAAGDTSLASSLNTGILYLMVMPYLMLIVIAYFWFKNSKKETAQRLKLEQIIKSKLS